MMCQRPSRTSRRMRANSAGSYSSTQRYSIASLWLNTKLSNSSQKSAAPRKVDSVSAAPSSHSHCQTGSMWALQII